MTRDRQWRRLPLYTVGLLALMLFGITAGAAPAPPGPSLAPMLESVLPAVVNISTRTRQRVQRNSRVAARG